MIERDIDRCAKSMAVRDGAREAMNVRLRLSEGISSSGRGRAMVEWGGVLAVGSESERVRAKGSGTLCHLKTDW